MVKLSRTIKQIKTSVVQVKLEYILQKKKSTEVLGTGFIIDRAGTIVTALHVVTGARSRIQQLKAQNPSNDIDHEIIRVGVPTHSVVVGELRAEAIFRNLSAKVIAEDDKNDVALLRIIPEHLEQLQQPLSFQDVVIAEGYPDPMQIHDGKVEEGDYIAISGYPLREANMVTTSGNIASTFTVDKQSEAVSYLGDITTNRGNSGGPVYRVEDGKAIGIQVAVRVDSRFEHSLQGIVEHSAGLAIITPIEHAQRLLESVNNNALK